MDTKIVSRRMGNVEAIKIGCLPLFQRFTVAFEFRRYEACGGTNLIKDDVFECVVCGAELSVRWNFG